MFENRVLRRIFEPKREGVTGGWGKLYKGEIRVIKWRIIRYSGYVA
jgi:hypothetical protein